MWGTHTEQQLPKCINDLGVLMCLVTSSTVLCVSQASGGLAQGLLHRLAGFFCSLELASKSITCLLALRGRFTWNI